MPDMAQMGSSIPAFLGKLWKMVDDPSTDDIICWNNTGQSFIINNPVKFTKELLPMYYKHNNLASFVRQLNMYGFHKVSAIESGGLKSENDALEFCHTCFIKGHRYLMQNIKRKLPSNRANNALLPTFVKDLEKGGVDIGSTELYTHLLAEINTMKGKQAEMDAKLKTVKRENESLWRELAIYRQKHLKQEQIINRLINFIVRMVSTRNIPLRKLPLMLDDVERGNKVSSSSSKGPTICELDDLLQDSTTISGRATKRKISLDQQPEMPSLTHDPDDDPDDAECSYRSPYVVMSPEEEVYAQPSPWLLTDGSDFDGEAMTPVNPLMVSMPDGFQQPEQPQEHQVKTSKQVPAAKKGRKMNAPRKRMTKTKQNKNKDILQETINLIQLNESDLASPGTSGVSTSQNQLPSATSQEIDEDVESNENILKILQDVASQPVIPPDNDDLKTDKAQDYSDPLTLALTRPNTSFAADDMARDIGSHVESVQTDLDVLKEFLKSDSCNFDANTLLELFDPMSLIMSAPDKDDNKEANNELMMYNSAPNLLDLAEMYGTTGNTNEATSSSQMPPLSPSILETPVMTPATPGLPSSSKKFRKEAAGYSN